MTKKGIYKILYDEFKGQDLNNTICPSFFYNITLLILGSGIINSIQKIGSAEYAKSCDIF